jgi:hypothetical protein
MMEASDVHTHILPSGWEDFAARFGGDRWPRLVGDPTARCQLFIDETLNRNLALAMTRLIFGGVLERWPAICWCFAPRWRRLRLDRGEGSTTAGT